MYEYFQQSSTNVHNYTLWCSRLSYNILYFYIWNPYTASSVFVNISFVHTQTKAWTIPTFNIFRGVRLEFSLCKHPKLIKWQTVQKFTFEMVQKFCHITVLCNATKTTENINCIQKCEFNLYIWLCRCIPGIYCSITCSTELYISYFIDSCLVFRPNYSFIVHV